MIKVEKTVLLDALKALKTSVAKENLQPILKCVHLKSEGANLTLTCTDTVGSARTTILVNSDTDINIAVQADKFEAICSKLDEIIELEVSDLLIIKSGKTKFKMLYVRGEEFPEVKFEYDEENKITLSEDDFVKGVSKTLVSTAQEYQSLLSGVCFSFDDNGYEMASTDGNRLSQVCFNEIISQEAQYVIPRKVLADVLKVVKDSVDIFFNKNKIILKTNNYIFSSVLLDGVFPKYRQLIPKDNPKKAIINRLDLINSLEKVSIMVNERTNIVTFDFNNNELLLTTNNDGETAKDDIEVDFNNTIKIAFNYKYLLDGLKAFSDKEVTFEMNEPLSPCLIKGDYTYLIMPIQIRG